MVVGVSAGTTVLGDMATVQTLWSKIDLVTICYFEACRCQVGFDLKFLGYTCNSAQRKLAPRVLVPTKLWQADDTQCVNRCSY
jgi:hypothetical protein